MRLKLADLKIHDVAIFSLHKNHKYTVKRLPIFLSPARMSLTTLSLVGSNLIIPGRGEFG